LIVILVENWDHLLISWKSPECSLKGINEKGKVEAYGLFSVW